MKRRPDRPPATRGRTALALTAEAARGGDRLPACAACGHVVYPARETCPGCLSDDLAWRPWSKRGTVLAASELRHSLTDYFRARLPWRYGSVRLDDGPVVMAHLAAGLAAGMSTTMRLRLDAAGQAVFVAGEGGVNLDPNDEIAGRTVLVTGASGGIGQELVAAFAAAGAARVLAAARDPARIAAAERVEPVALDLADPASIAALATQLGDAVDILVNNAGVNGVAGLLDADDLAAAEAEMQVNYFGPLRLIRALAPGLKARGRGVIVNMLTVLAHVNLPAMGSYCASKAAAASLTQGARAELAPWGVRVVGIYPGAVDTAMAADFPPPKLSPRAVAEAAVAAIGSGLEDVYPGQMAQNIYHGLRQDPKVVEREMGDLLPEPR